MPHASEWKTVQLHDCFMLRVRGEHAKGGLQHERHMKTQTPTKALHESADSKRHMKTQHATQASHEIADSDRRVT